jgi:hypothetical protein
MIKSALDAVMVQKKQSRAVGGSIGHFEGSSANAIPANVLAAVEHTLPESQDEETLEGRSLCIFGPSNTFRKWLAYVIWHPRFEQGIIFLILFSSVTLALDAPGLDPHGKTKRFLVRC